MGEYSPSWHIFFKKISCSFFGPPFGASPTQKNCNTQLIDLHLNFIDSRNIFTNLAFVDNFEMDCICEELLWTDKSTSTLFRCRNEVHQSQMSSPNGDFIAAVTRMHSSMMSTGRSLTVCWSLLPRGGDGWGMYLVPGGVLSPGGVYLVPRGVC